LKKILIYTDVPFFAGCENVIENIVSYPAISRKYRTIYCYAKSNRYQNDVEERVIDVPLNPINVLSNSSLFMYIDSRINSPFLVSMLKAPFRILERLHFYNIVNYFILYRIVAHEKPDIVHINNGGYPGANSCRVMALAAKKAGANRIIFTVNNMAVNQRGFIDKAMDRKIGDRVDRFTTASKTALCRLHEKRNFSYEKLISIPRGVLHDAGKIDITKRLRREFGIEKDVCVVGSIGLLIDRKGYHILVEAIKGMETKTKYCAVIFGDGERRRRLTKMIKDYDLENKVLLPGHRNNIYDYLIEMDVFVLPSINNEDHPNVISEAMLFNKPIVGTQIAVSEQIDHGETGFIVKEGDVEGLREALQTMIDLNAEKRYKMGQKAGNKYREEFSYQASMQKYLELYDSLLG